MFVEKRGGNRAALDVEKIHKAVSWACEGLSADPMQIEQAAHIMFFDGIKTAQIHDSLIQAAAELIDVDAQDYSKAAARLLLQKTYKEVTGGPVQYPTLASYLNEGVEIGRLDPVLLSRFDLSELDAVIVPERDLLFEYLGMRTLFDRYLLRRDPKRSKAGRAIEMPQHLWMRVAMGLAVNEDCPTAWAIQFYHLLSQLKFVSSTPTLFNSGTLHPQMSSCYLTTVDDSIWENSACHTGRGIFATITDCALLSKFAGGLGVDWTRVRPAGSHIKSTNGVSSGIIPYLKVFSDTSVAVNQGGKRQGAFSAYLEPWHGDIERFIDLRKPKGDERLRAREVFTVNWLNSLFMERVEQRGKWSLFDSHEYPELAELYGDDFKQRYEELEAKGKALKTLDAMELWKKMITALVESGGPWITFKDEANRRNTQPHVGPIRSSNLCTEITLPTSDSEIAVCNLGSINIARTHPSEFCEVVPLAMRMLDNVIDINFYPVDKAEISNTLHRPVGLGMMGWGEFLAMNGVGWESQENLDLTDKVFEAFSYWAIQGSMMLAKERGRYPTFEGSLWSYGVLPMHTAKNEAESLAHPLDNEFMKGNLWIHLERDVANHGMRNSFTMAIAPTATISNIAGTTSCIEPSVSHVFMEDNKSGKFKVVDPALRHLPPEKVKTAYQIDQVWLIKAAAIRQKWLDQSQSVNLFKRADVKGRELSDWFFLAWKLGLKSTYYLRQQITTITETRTKQKAEEEAKFCSIDNPDCEACQ